MGRDDCSSGRKRNDSFTHHLDQLEGKSRSCVRCIVEKMKDGRISWYPWSVQITVTKLAVARVGPSGLGGRVGV